MGQKTTKPQKLCHKAKDHPTKSTYIEFHNTIKNKHPHLLDHTICTTMQWQKILWDSHILRENHHLTCVDWLFPCNPNICHNPTPLLTSCFWICHKSWLKAKSFLAFHIVHKVTPQAMYYIVENIMTYILIKGAPPCLEVNPNDNKWFLGFFFIGEELPTFLGCVCHRGHRVLTSPNSKVRE